MRDGMRRSPSFLLAALVGCALLAVACGGGDGGGGGTGELAATFTPDRPSPPTGSISLQKGTEAGETFEVRVVATGIDDLFGAAFHVTFGSGSARFEECVADESVLVAAGLPTDIRCEADGADVAVLVTRVQNTAGTVPGVDLGGEGELIRLRFTATARTGGNAFALGSPREAVDPGEPPSNQIAVEWHGGVLTAR